MTEFENAFGRPFNNKGKPSAYLAFLVPLLEKEYTTKQEMLKMVGIDLNSQPEKRGSHATTLATFTRLKILETRPRGDGTWRRGERWAEFMWWLIQKNNEMRKEVKNRMFQLEHNSLDYIFKD
jgi:hypothetical protein